MHEHSRTQDIVLIGGGLSHAAVLKQWASNPLPGVRLTLVSSQLQSVYTDMLPGVIAGHFSYSDTHINLPRLCRAAGARFIQACAHQIDPAQKTISLLGRPPLEYDLLSLDVGASPDRNIAGCELAIPVKPADHFHRYWQQLEQEIRENHQPLRIGIIGGDNGDCALAMAMAWALEEPIYSGRVEIHLMHPEKKVPSGYPLLARRLIARECAALGVRVHRNCNVSEITRRGVHTDNGSFIALDRVLLCTRGTAPPWLGQSGLMVNDSGFIQVDNSLKAIGHQHIFAAGEAAAQSEKKTTYTRAQAQRQGDTLFRNLCAQVLGRPLRRGGNGVDLVQIMTCGNRRAIVAQGPLAAIGELAWRWKNRNDHHYLQYLNATTTSPSNPSVQQKSNVQHDVSLLRTGVINAAYPLRHSASRATPVSIPGDKVMVQHTQQFSAPISDPWLFARLAVQQALSEIIATGAQPCSAQLLVNLPDTEPVAARRDLQQLLDGAKHELNQHGCELLQGQVSQGAALQLGLTVNGLVAREQLLEERAARAGDCLILTKPLGTGVLLTADAQGKAQTRWLQQGLDAMLQGNTGAAEILHQHRANAVIHVAERGLLGHLLELLQWRRGHYLDGLGESVSPADTRKRCGALGASLFAEQLPLLPGAVPCLRHGLLVTPSQHSPFSSDPIMTLQNAAAWRSEPYLPLLSDPQICGGLLAAVPAEQADACLLALHAAGCDHSTIIGIVEELPVSEDHASCAPQPINLVKGGNWEKMAERYSETVT